MKQSRAPAILVLAVLAVALITAGCMTSPAPAAPGDTLSARADMEFRNNNLHAAESLYRMAQENYTVAGNTAAAKAARDRVLAMQMMTFHFPYNRSTMDGMLAGVFPALSAAERAALLDDPGAVTQRSDGEVWYFEDTISNIVYHNMTIMQAANAKKHYNPFYDELAPLALAPAPAAGAGTGPYSRPVTWEGIEAISIPCDRLPATGTLQLWVPLPVGYGPQQNVTIVSLEPARYLRSTTGPGADIGVAYFMIPLEEVSDPFVNVSARFRFTEYTQTFTVDPAKVKPYNTGSRSTGSTPHLRLISSSLLR